MDSSLQQLFQLESNLSQAQEFLGSSTTNQTSLLSSHLEKLTTNSTSTQGLNDLNYQDVKELLTQKGSFDLSLCCSACNQSIYENDSMAQNQQPKQILQKCCLDYLNSTKTPDDLEITFWWFLINNFSNCISTLPNYTRFMITNGIPASLRDRIWGVLTFSNDSQGTVDEYLLNLYESLNKDISPDIRIITKDVERTYPFLSIFQKSETKLKISKILNAFSIYDSDMGYCQGLQFIVSPIFFHFENDFKTFNSLIKFFEINKLRYLYDSKMSGLQKWFNQFEKILSLELPSLYKHFIELGIDLKIFLSQWFLSFYSITIPFQFLIRVFDIMMFEGVKPTLLRIGICILSKNLNLLMQINDSELIYQHLLSEMCWGVFGNNLEGFIMELMNLDLKNFIEEEEEDQEQEEEEVDSTTILSKVLNNLSFKSDSNSSSSSLNESIFSNDSKITNNTSTTNTTSTTTTDLELIEKLYKLCLSNDINDPILNKVKDRLYG
ncbi:TBC1 domain protein [Wickerhamomyces ciferrii]|uniref:TBC1 domain protein n=1 Tax=Wickerhamomyces ciferrii (strain ATCC 14091 / BCRC 22168 / CBS 111 / JCM 3599 / NBRC 0793 / NRRL Y-1031 F-60-10) TaxID=1206466 RepID=K0KKM6_WICCF|nr:TBC1 domain protein [Wickerhamomyces ciferrii]CCH43546.1 TBC1 domain protein [Wickerhamomyces ciferrii]